MNTFGNNLRLTTFGESHGPAMGGVLDGFPPGFKIDFSKVNEVVAERRPGKSPLVTGRQESDLPEFLSGISPEGITLGSPIGFIVRNSDQRSKDYEELKDIYRPGHADFTYMARYGIRDHRGGGRASARETVSRVVAGALALQWLKSKGIKIESVISGVGNIIALDIFNDKIKNSLSHNFSLEIPDEIKMQMEDLIKETKLKGDSVGGRVSCLITGVKPGLGDPVYHKLHASLAEAMMGINAAKGFEYGAGFDLAESLGSETTDSFIPGQIENYPSTTTNFSGGIQGGISNGMPIFFNVAFKPTPTLGLPVPTVNTRGEKVILKARGRHDPCVAVRAVPIVKAMAALVIMDFML